MTGPPRTPRVPPPATATPTGHLHCHGDRGGRGGDLAHQGLHRPDHEPQRRPPGPNQLHLQCRCGHQLTPVPSPAWGRSTSRPSSPNRPPRRRASTGEGPSRPLGAEVTVPATVINHFRNLGATSLTVGSQSNTEAGHPRAERRAGRSPRIPSRPRPPTCPRATPPSCPASPTPTRPTTTRSPGRPGRPRGGPLHPGGHRHRRHLRGPRSPTNEAITCTPPPAPPPWVPPR